MKTGSLSYEKKITNFFLSHLKKQYTVSSSSRSLSRDKRHLQIVKHYKVIIMYSYNAWVLVNTIAIYDR